MQHVLCLETAAAVSDRQQRSNRIPLGNAEIFYYPAWLNPAESSALLQLLLKETPWRQDTLKFAGKAVPVPRLQAWYGDSSSHYGYSGLHLEPLPWTPALTRLRQRLEDSLNLSFNSVLINYYRNGQDSVAWHSDSEPALGPDPSIASLSLGATRRFDMKRYDRNNQPGKLSLALADGSLLLMGSGVQQHWLHQIPKEPAITAPRINLTFRLICTMA
jgi:alkylated DNA repair dioxygenase AlkB